MFGYVNVNGKELSEEARDTYQAYYCGLCHSLFRNYGAGSRLLLSYDITFLVFLLTGLYEPVEEQTKAACPRHPIRKPTAMKSEILDYAAAMNVVLAYHNLEDDWADEKNPAKHAIALGIRKDYRRAAACYPRQSETVERCVRQLSQLEAQGAEDIDQVAGLTGEMLGELLAWREDEWYQELKTLGMNLGKFIYLMDAWEDLDRDAKKNSYNPLLRLKAEKGDDFEPFCQQMLTGLMAQSAAVFERLPILPHADILRNILYSGVWTRYEYRQLKKRGKKK